ncbi:unnamed protein product [Allacma fusca]|uniref:Aldehyde dehydrogenase domain-containing protein n=1 Tax=Allacma fusca TaxID=39272 RepID=A0A8J2NSQ3_9HEXA|nr:unnamed protein product [Allacma fusca]
MSRIEVALREGGQSTEETGSGPGPSPVPSHKEDLCDRVVFNPKNESVKQKTVVQVGLYAIKIKDDLGGVPSVIDEKAYYRIADYIGHAKSNLQIVHFGTNSKKEGLFINPTLVETTDPADKIMRQEIFGPVVSTFVYPDAEIDSVLKLVDETTPFALTGAVFAEDEAFLKKATETLKYASGNYYINDRSTGAVVGPLPFGGGRHSGTNDKAGAPGYLYKFTTPQTESSKPSFHLRTGNTRTCATNLSPMSDNNMKN